MPEHISSTHVHATPVCKLRATSRRNASRKYTHVRRHSSRIQAVRSAGAFEMHRFNLDRGTSKCSCNILKHLPRLHLCNRSTITLRGTRSRQSTHATSARVGGTHCQGQQHSLKKRILRMTVGRLDTSTSTRMRITISAYVCGVYTECKAMRSSFHPRRVS